MTETIEDRLRRVLSAAATVQVPDDAPVPPRRTGDTRSERLAYRRWTGPVVIGIAAAAIVIATLVLVHAQRPNVAAPTRPVITSTSATSLQFAVPQVLGLTRAAAEKAVDAAGLTIGSEVLVESSTVPVGTVVSTDPSPGTSLGAGGPVTLLISNSVTAVVAPPGGTAGDVTVPTDLVGKSYGQAVSELKAAGLTATKQSADSVEPPDTVLALVGLEPGLRVQAGTPVSLRVSNNRLFTMPNLANLTPAEAAVVLIAAGWTGTPSSIRTLSARTTDLSAVGRISAAARNTVGPVFDSGWPQPPQTPAAGAAVSKSAQVTVVVLVGR